MSNSNLEVMTQLIAKHPEVELLLKGWPVYVSPAPAATFHFGSVASRQGYQVTFWLSWNQDGFGGKFQAAIGEPQEFQLERGQIVDAIKVLVVLKNYIQGNGIPVDLNPIIEDALDGSASFFGVLNPYIREWRKRRRFIFDAVVMAQLELEQMVSQQILDELQALRSTLVERIQSLAFNEALDYLYRFVGVPTSQQQEEALQEVAEAMRNTVLYVLNSKPNLLEHLNRTDLRARTLRLAMAHWGLMREKFGPAFVEARLALMVSERCATSQHVLEDPLNMVREQIKLARLHLG